MKLHVIVHAVALWLLAGCGGGGGGDGGGNNNSGGPITAQNAPLVASAAQSAISESSDGGASGTDFFVASVSGGPTKDFNLADLAIDQVLRLRKSAGLLTTAATDTCTGGSGTVTTDFSDNDGSADFSSGDSLSLFFVDCMEAGVLINGGFTVTINAFTGDPTVPGSNFSLAISLTFNNFVVSEGVESGEIDGSLTVSASGSGSTETITVISSGLAIRDTSTGQVLTLNGFSVTEEYDVTTGAYAISVTGSVNDSRVGFNVAATTLTPLAAAGFTDPTSGSIRLTAGDGTSVTVTATGDGPGGDGVRLDVDTNGDGTTDSTIITSWTELAALS